MYYFLTCRRGKGFKNVNFIIYYTYILLQQCFEVNNTQRVKKKKQLIVHKNWYTLNI